MSQIVPTILTNDRARYYSYYQTFATFAKRVQVDITDGIFAPTRTIDVSNALHEQNWPPMDLHMMVMRPSEHLPIILKLKPSLCIFHAECSENLLPIFDTLKKAGIKTGVAILKQTYPGKLTPYIQQADHCLIFAGKLGEQGGEADMLQIEKVPIIRKINSAIEIGWDGGANMSNVRALAHSDIDVINVGSAFSNAEDPKKLYEELNQESEKQGVCL